MLYQLKAVSDEINCSSSGDHFVDITYIKHGRRYQASYWFEGRAVSGQREPAVNVPLYFLRQIERELYYGVFLKGAARYFEYDRDGNKRWEDLRYHPDDWGKRWMESWAVRHGT